MPIKLLITVTATALLVAVAAAVAPRSAIAHRSGSWLYPPEVRHKLDLRGHPGAACDGRGRYKWTRHSNPNNLQTWQYKHFECHRITNDLIFICVHSLSSRRIAISRVMKNNDYRPCRF